MTSVNGRGLGLRAAAALFALGLAMGTPAARAGLINVSPTGSGGPLVPSVAGFDLAPGNALARNALPLGVGQTFQLYYQASVSGFIDQNGLTSTPAGLGTKYQITAVASFTEVVRSVNSSNLLATFSLASVQNNSFFQLYYTPIVSASNLAGTGFNLGTLILSASPSTTSASVGSFTNAKDASGNPVIRPLDQFVTNHYPGQSTVTGTGSALVTANVNYVDPTFFKSNLTQLTFNSSLVTPFAQTSPSAKFLSHPGAGAPDITPNLGSVNGLNGKDFLFQADANFSFGAVTPFVSVPEPASLVLAGLGLAAALGAHSWKNRKPSRA